MKRKSFGIKILLTTLYRTTIIKSTEKDVDGDSIYIPKVTESRSS